MCPTIEQFFEVRSRSNTNSSQERSNTMFHVIVIEIDTVQQYPTMSTLVHD